MNVKSKSTVEAAARIEDNDKAKAKTNKDAADQAKTETDNAKKENVKAE